MKNQIETKPQRNSVMVSIKNSDVTMNPVLEMTQGKEEPTTKQPTAVSKAVSALKKAVVKVKGKN